MIHAVSWKNLKDTKDIRLTMLYKTIKKIANVLNKRNINTSRYQNYKQIWT